MGSSAGMQVLEGFLAVLALAETVPPMAACRAVPGTEQGEHRDDLFFETSRGRSCVSSLRMPPLSIWNTTDRVRLWAISLLRRPGRRAAAWPGVDVDGVPLADALHQRGESE